MDIQTKIKSAFANRSKPITIIVLGSPETDEYLDALAIGSIEESEINCDLLEKYPSCIFGFSPDAFLFFLPRILLAVINEKRPSISVCESLIGMLDRSFDFELFDSFFLKRWAALAPEECDACLEWVIWLTDYENIFVFGNELSRASDMLSLISKHNEAQTR